MFQKYQFIPPWTMPLMLICFAAYRLYTHPYKLKMMINDFKDPQFLGILLLIFLFLFFVIDPNSKRSKVTNDHAIIAGISAYFGHLDLPLSACFLLGCYTYYTYKPPDALSDE